MTNRASMLAESTSEPPTRSDPASSARGLGEPAAAQPARKGGVSLRVNSTDHLLSVDVRSTLLDTLREDLGLTGAKRGCNHGQCGACTVLVGGRRVLSCLLLTVKSDGRTITTIEGLTAPDGSLHPLQQAFLDHDGLQCGFCTPGQILSGVGCIDEGHAGSADEIREYMSGNLCRCGAYAGIVKAILGVVTLYAGG